MANHVWKPTKFEPNGIYNNVATCLQHWRCSECGEREALPQNYTPTLDGCTPKPREKVHDFNLRDMEKQKSEGREIPLKGRRFR